MNNSQKSFSYVCSNFDSTITHKIKPLYYIIFRILSVGLKQNPKIRETENEAEAIASFFDTCLLSEPLTYTIQKEKTHRPVKMDILSLKDLVTHSFVSSRRPLAELHLLACFCEYKRSEVWLRPPAVGDDS